MTNLNCHEINHLWHCCRTVFNEKLMVERGKKTDVSIKDILFIVLCVVKAATNWNVMGQIFEKKDLHFSSCFLALSTSCVPSSIKIVFSIALQSCQ